MSDRKRAIETLKQLRLDYEEFYEEHNNEVTQAYDMAISSLETDEAYQLEYEPTTKNDLEVDAISRSDVLKLMQDNWHTHNGDWAMQESMDDIRALPAVTPQEPKTGHWIESDAVLVMGYSETDNFLRIPAKECSVCHKPHIRAYRMNYCPKCGAKMESEVEDGNDATNAESN